MDDEGIKLEEEGCRLTGGTRWTLAYHDIICDVTIDLICYMMKNIIYYVMIDTICHVMMVLNTLKCVTNKVIFHVASRCTIGCE